MNKIICPKDCPNRRASPNCHNAATCETWAKHEAETEQIRAARARQQKAGDGIKAVRASYRNGYFKDYDKNYRRKRK